MLSLMLLGIFIPIFAMNVVHTIEWIGDANRRGLGFSSASWHNSEVIDYLQEVDENLYFLSNAPDGIYFWTRRMAGMIPETTDEAEQLARRKYLEEGYDDIWIVFFRGGFRKGEVPAERELKLDLGLEPVFGDEEASIYSFQFGG